MSNSEKKKILLIIPKDIHFGVVESQMLGLAKLYSERFEVLIAVHSSIKLESKNFKISPYNNTYQILKELKGIDHVYFRNVYNFLFLFIFCKIKFIKTIYDFRGLSSFENYNTNKSYFKFIVLYFLELVPYLFSNLIQCVSFNMEKELHKIYIIKRRMKVVPCLTSNCIRRSDPCDKKVKFVYVGGMSKWQMIDQIIDVLIEVEKNVDCLSTFITKEKSFIQEKLKKKSLKSYVIKSGNNNEVKSFLSKQDFGLIFRENRILNKVSSPIKFLEYTSSGVIPIMTPSVGNYSDDLKKYNLGLIYDNDNRKLIKDIIDVSKQAPKYRDRLFNYSTKMTWFNYHLWKR